MWQVISAFNLIEWELGYLGSSGEHKAADGWIADIKSIWLHTRVLCPSPTWNRSLLCIYQNGTHFSSSYLFSSSWVFFIDFSEISEPFWIVLQFNVRDWVAKSKQIPTYSVCTRAFTSLRNRQPQFETFGAETSQEMKTMRMRIRTDMNIRYWKI